MKRLGISDKTLRELACIGLVLCGKTTEGEKQ